MTPTIADATLGPAAAIAFAKDTRYPLSKGRSSEAAATKRITPTAIQKYASHS
jgi:hypothetical protein